MPKRTLTDAERYLLETALPPVIERTRLLALVTGAEPADAAHARAHRNLYNALAGQRTDADFLDDVRRAGECLLRELQADHAARFAYYSAATAEALASLNATADALAKMTDESAALDLPGPTGGLTPFDWFEQPREAPDGLVPLSEAAAEYTRRPGKRPGKMPHRADEARRPAYERARDAFDAGEG